MNGKNINSQNRSSKKNTNKIDDKDYVVIDFNKKDKYDENRDMYGNYINPKSSKATMEEFKRVKKIIDEESASVRKKKKRKKENKALVIFWTSIIIIFVIIIVCAILMLTLPIFNLTGIQLYGSDKYLVEDISKSVNLNVGQNIFITLFKSNKNSIKNDYPYIETLKFKYKFPSTLKINVIERENRYYTFNKDDSNYYILDRSGNILDKVQDSSSWENEILVSGITFDSSVVLGEKINDIDIKKLNNFEKFYDTLNSYLEGCSITRVTFVNEYMKIYVNSKVEIVFEARKDVSDYNFALVKLIIKDVEGQSGTIDMTRKEPTFVKN